MILQINTRAWNLQTNTDVMVILPSHKEKDDPKEFFRSGRKYPVLWLLHGSWGGYNDYLRRTNIELYATENDLAVVMPEALNSDYSNWPDAMGGFNMFDFLTEELMPMMQGWFPISDKREDNFICGLSMGGTGAVKYAVNHPELFAGCSSMSSAPRNMRRIYESGEITRRQLASIQKSGGIEAYLDSYENVWDRCKDIAAMENPPRFYFTCGDQDALYPGYLEFKKYAQRIGFPAVFVDRPGFAHEWRLWEEQIQETLRFFGFDKSHTTPSNPGANAETVIIDPSSL